MMDSPSGALWSIMTIAGPILLGAVLLWALLRNRKATPREIKRTEDATRALYNEENAAQRADDDRVA